MSGMPRKRLIASHLSVEVVTMASKHTTPRQGPNHTICTQTSWLHPNHVLFHVTRQARQLLATISVGTLVPYTFSSRSVAIACSYAKKKLRAAIAFRYSLFCSAKIVVARISPAAPWAEGADHPAWPGYCCKHLAMSGQLTPASVAVLSPK